MALTLHSMQSSLTRPNRPKDPNGIAHGSRDGGTAAQTKADRVVTKAAYTTWNKAGKLHTSLVVIIVQNSQHQDLVSHMQMIRK